MRVSGSAASARDGGREDGDGRRLIPRTDAVLADPRLADAQARLGRGAVRAAVRQVQDRMRAGEPAPDGIVGEPALERIVGEVLALLPPARSGLQRVINATGVLLHTNLGRAPLSQSAVDAVTLAAGATDVEYDVATGERARRGRSALAALAAAVPAAQDVHVVNNGAVALVLAATALASGREILISRGEMVEIGAGFRLPDLLVCTGARLREVGTTNRTSLQDYADAVGPDTAFLLKVHPSNFVVSGFTAAVGVAELAGLGMPVVADIGSGLLAPHPALPDEPDAASTLQAGAALVTASGDKLLGGPQAGLLFGRAAVVERLRMHPLARALRVDKLTLAALEATLRGPATPTAIALDMPAAVLLDRARVLAALLAGAWRARRSACRPPLPSGCARGSPPVVGRVERGRCLLDLRGVPAGDDGDLRAAVLAAVAGPAPATPI